MKERFDEASYKEFEDQGEHLIRLLSDQTLNYLTNKFKGGKAYDYVLNLVIHSYVSAMIQVMLTISNDNIEVREKVVGFVENILDNFGYRIKDFKDVKIN